MTFNKEASENYSVYALEGDIRTEDDLKELEIELLTLLVKRNQNIIFNLAKVKFMNSDGLNFMVRVLTALRANDGELILTNLPEKFTNLMLITKLNSIFTIYRSTEEAIDIIKSKKSDSEGTNEEE